MSAGGIRVAITGKGGSGKTAFAATIVPRATRSSPVLPNTFAPGASRTSSSITMRVKADAPDGKCVSARPSVTPGYSFTRFPITVRGCTTTPKPPCSRSRSAPTRTDRGISTPSSFNV